MLTQELLLLLQRKLVENLPEESDCWMSGGEIPFVNSILQRGKRRGAQRFFPHSSLLKLYIEDATVSFTEHFHNY